MTDDFTKDEESAMDAKTENYVQNLLQEKHQLDANNFPNASRLIQEEINKAMESTRHRPDQRYIDIYHGKPTKVVQKVEVPLRVHPKFNFVGKLLGPKGNTLKRLQEETLCRMSILGRGSMKDKNKEEDLRQGLDPKFSHLSDELHVEVSALAPAAEAHARMAYALVELRKYLTPDHNDDIALAQQREMEEYSYDDNINEMDGNGLPPPHAPPVMRGGRGRGGRGGILGRGSRGGGFVPRGAPRGRGNLLRGVLRGDGDPYFGGRGNDGPPAFAPSDVLDGVQRRGPNLGGPRDEGIRGRWKLRGGHSRFMERNAPYTRRE